MRSAAKVASASWIATPGSLSPVSPAASTPSSSRRSTVSSCAASASPIASSESETQNATLDGWWRGRRRAPRRPRPRRRAWSAAALASTGSGVTTSSFTPLRYPSPRRRQTGCRAVRAHDTTATSSRSRPPWTASALALDGLGDRRRRRLPRSRAAPRRAARARAPRRPGRLDHAVGVQHQRVARAELDAAPRSDSGVATIPSSVPGAPTVLDVAVGPQHAAGAGGRRRPGTRHAVRRVGRQRARTPPCRSGSRGAGAAAPR